MVHLNYIKKVYIYLTIFTTFFTTYSQIKHIDIAQVDNAMRVKPQNTVILISAEWCSYCKVQSKMLYRKDIIELPQSFYFTELCAEEKRNIQWANETYSPSPKKVHTLVQKLQKDKKQMVYPYWVVVDKNFRVIYQYAGFLKPLQLKKMLTQVNGAFTEKTQ